MKNFLLLASVSLASLFFAACGEAPPPEAVEVTEEVTQTVPLGAGRTLVLDGYNGALTIAGRNDSTATFRFTKRATGPGEAAARQLLDRIAIETKERADAVAVTLSSEASDSTSVDVRAEVPFKTPLRLELDNGAVEINAMTGSVTLDVRNGRVGIQGAANGLDVETGNGDIDVEMIGFRDSTQVSLAARNGAITLALPSSAAAALEAETQVGEIVIEGLELKDREEERRTTGSRLRAVLRAGTGRLALRTENGTITLKGK